LNSDHSLLRAPRFGLLARALVLGALGATVTTPAARARPEHTLIDHDWNVVDGLPQGTVNSIALDHQGFLLLATYGGLSRFNGQRFERISLPLEAHPNISRTTALAPQGERLWFGVEGGGLWLYSAEGVAADANQPPELSTSVIHALAVDPQGRLLVASRSGAYRRLSEGNWEQLATGRCNDIDVSAQGIVWISRATDVGWLAPNQTTPQWTSLTIADERGISGGALDAAGRYWVVGRNGLALLQAGQAPHIEPRPPNSPFSMGSPVFDRQGGLWLGAESGVYHISDAAKAAQDMQQRTRLKLEFTALKGDARSLFVDNSGGIWIGTSGKGLLRLSPNIWEALYENPEDLKYGYGPLVAPEQEDHGYLFASCYTVIHKEDDPLRPVLRQEAGDPTQPDRCVRALHRLPNGDVLVGGDPGLKLHKVDGTREDLGPAVGLQVGEVVTVIEAQRAPGRFYLGTSQGRVLEGSLGASETATIDAPWGPRLANPRWGTVLDLLSDGDDLWIGTAEGLIRLSGNVPTLFDAETGFPPSAVRALAKDPEGRVWATTYGGGLGWVLGEKVGTIPVGADALPDGHLSGIYFDTKGYVWLHGNQGLFTIRAEDLQERTRKPEHALRVSLIETGEANGWIQPSMVPLPDGDLLLANVDRVVHVRIDATHDAGNVGKTQIRSLELGGQTFRGEVVADASLRRDLRVTFSAPALSTRRPLEYRWRLRPANDSDSTAPWSQPSDSNLVELVDLEPGEHTFEVFAVPNDGRKAEATAVSVIIQRRPWEHDWAKVLGLVAFLGLSIQIGRLRAREVQKRNEQLQSEIELRKRAEREASQQGAYYRTLFECGATALLLFMPDGRCVAANPQARGLLDPQGLGLTGRMGAELGLGSAVAEATEERAELLVQCLRLGEGAFPAQVVVTRFLIHDKPQVMCAVVDLSRLVESEQKQTQLRDALTSARRLEGVGRLAGGVAHDINNMMTAILGNTELAIEMQPDGPAREFLDEVRLAVGRGSALVRELLSFGRRPQTESEVLDPKEVIDAMVGMLRRLLPDDICMVLDLQPVPAVRIPRTALEQILLNLIVNASDAMPRGGEVRVSTWREGSRWAIIEVTDQGVGISPDIADHIFEPFFSTKSADRGTGLGLATVRDLAHRAEARVEVQSEVGAGTTFRLRFPAVSSDSVSIPPSAPEPRPVASSLGGQLILVVDDNDGVRNAAITQPLRRAGYEVMDFADPQEALRWFQQTPRPPAAVVSDVIMPGLNGKQMTDQMRELQPDLAVLFVTGYAADVVWKRGLSETADMLLEKPFTSGALLDSLHQLLLRRASASAPAAPQP